MSNVRTIIVAIRIGIIGALLAAPLLWAPRASAASPPITPAYLACTNGGILNSCDNSYQIIEGTAPNPSTYTSWPIGYVDTTSIAGTEGTYLACTRGGILNSCDNSYQIIRGAAPSQSTYVSWLIGYTFTTQVAGSEAAYLACTRGGILNSCDNSYKIIRGAAPSSSTYVSWFIGYVFPTVPVTTYTAIPKYYIGSVIYVPPGPGSYIQYGTGTNTGTTLSMMDSYSDTSTAGPSEGTPNGSTASYNITFNISDAFGGSTMTSTDVELTDNVTEKYQAPSSNLLNHDYDQILLFFGATVTETVDYYGNITWGVSFASLNNTDDAASGYPVSVGCLRPNSTIPAAQCASTIAFLTSMKITSSDYPNMMNADPFANPSGSPVPSSSRFVKLDSFSYYGDPTTVTYTYGVVNSTTVTNSVTTSYSYTEGFSGTLFGLKIGNSVTFTDSSTKSNKTQSTDTSMLSLTMPTTAYSGPNTLNVYEDTVYKTFMFSFY
jgi:hypothetical protein